MSPSPWTDLEPQPGEFDADLATIDPRFLEARPGERSVARRNGIAESFIKVEPRVALALACAPVRHELIDATVEIVELAPKRLQTAAAHVR